MSRPGTTCCSVRPESLKVSPNYHYYRGIAFPHTNAMQVSSAQSAKDIRHTMRTSTEAARKGASPAEILPPRQSSASLLQQLLNWLDEAKAEELVTIDLKGKSSIGDFMVVVSGRSDRHVGAIAEQVHKHLKEAGRNARVEGMPTCDWVLIDAGDIIVHVFRPEVREFYNLEKMWLGERLGENTSH